MKAGSDVRMNGVLVGSVSSIKLNQESFRATAMFTVSPGIKLPRDTVAQVASESLLGGKYLSLEVGVDDETIPTDGKGRLTHTTPPMRLDDLIGQLIYKEDKKGPPPPNSLNGGMPPQAAAVPAPAPVAAPVVAPAVAGDSIPQQ